jgi:hypothetical protein
MMYEVHMQVGRRSLVYYDDHKLALGAKGYKADPNHPIASAKNCDIVVSGCMLFIQIGLCYAPVVWPHCISVR